MSFLKDEMSNFSQESKDNTFGKLEVSTVSTVIIYVAIFSECVQIFPLPLIVVESFDVQKTRKDLLLASQAVFGEGFTSWNDMSKSDSRL